MTLRLAFMGTPDFAVPTLAELVAQGHAIAAVYSQPPRRKGRGMETAPTPVARFATSAGLDLRTPASLKTPDEQEAFAALELDAAIVVAYGLILPKAILDAPRLGCFNLHASLLPRWRGAAPIQRAIMAGDRETGVMVMQMEEGLDTGPVLMAERMDIGELTAGEVTDRLSHLGADLMVRALGGLERGAITATPQDESGVTYAHKITKDEARIAWTGGAHQIGCHIRGLSPWPGAWSEVLGERLKILRATPTDGKGQPGEVLADASGDLVVACGQRALKIQSVQRAGKAVMDARQMLLGFALAPGTIFV